MKTVSGGHMGVTGVGNRMVACPYMPPGLPALLGCAGEEIGTTSRIPRLAHT